MPKYRLVPNQGSNRMFDDIEKARQELAKLNGQGHITYTRSGLACETKWVRWYDRFMSIELDKSLPPIPMADAHTLFMQGAGPGDAVAQALAAGWYNDSAGNLRQLHKRPRKSKVIKRGTSHYVLPAAVGRAAGKRGASRSRRRSL